MEHKFTNGLIHETSPYLLQHAHNPVNWLPWGPDALKLANELNRPIFLSIGYAACHWCHVMEHESFEDEETAEILNEYFVPIKVDREERPDLDEIYMNATILFTRGHGGWPMSVWITPEGKPFYAGTYFPPNDFHGRPGFKSVLMRLAEVWRESSEAIASDAVKVTEMIRNMHQRSISDALSRDDISNAVGQMLPHFDSIRGGVGSGGNKFPPSMSLELLLQEYRRSGNKEVLGIVTLTLDEMSRGGIYDHLGGGIHRYSTDSQWLVPHFEKMLYDQALVSSIYLSGYQVTGKKEFADTARGIFDYVLRSLQSEEGGFYSAEDADSEGKEGKFYIWTLEEVKAAVGDEYARLFCAYYDITEQGNWIHPGDAHVPSGPKNILRILKPMSSVAKELAMSEEALAQRLGAARAKLFTVREKRVHPSLDDKVLTAWNGLMIASFVRGAQVLDEPEYLIAATRAADFLLRKMEKNGRLLRSYGKGIAKVPAFIDDYAFLIDALLALFGATGTLRWLNDAERLMETALRFYWDNQDGGFFFTASDSETLIVRSKQSSDNAIPSGNSVMLSNLTRMSVLLGRRDLREKADAILKLLSGAATQSPFGHERLLNGAVNWHDGFNEVAIVGDQHDTRTKDLRRMALSGYRPNQLLVLLDPSDPDITEIRKRVPLLADKEQVNSAPTAFVCRNYTCELPTNNPEQFRKQLELNVR